MIVHELKEVNKRKQRVAICGEIDKLTSSDLSYVTCIRCRPELADIPASWGWKNSSNGGRKL